MNETGKCVALIAFGAILGWGVTTIWPFAPFEPTKKDWVDVTTALGTCAAVVVALAIAVFQFSIDTRRRRVATEKGVLIAELRAHEQNLALANRLSWLASDFVFYLNDLREVRIRNSRFKLSDTELDEWFQRCADFERDEPNYDKLGDLFEFRRVARNTLAMLRKWEGFVPQDFREQGRLVEIQNSLSAPLDRIYKNVHSLRDKCEHARSRLAEHEEKHSFTL